MRAAIAVIGGGWAGCAAALTLASHGARVDLYESANVLGGRARRVVRDGLPLDNGQHLILGAYAKARQLLALAHGDATPPIVSSPLAIAPLSDAQPNALALAARSARPPFGLLFGVLAARGLTLAERLATIAGVVRWQRRGWRCAPEVSAADLMAELPLAVARKLWEPLCIAALNTPSERASGQVFLNVARAAFASTPDGSDVFVASADLSTLFPEAVERWLTSHGHAVHRSTPVRLDGIGVDGVALRAHDRTLDARGAILAVGPHQLPHVVSEAALAAAPELKKAIDAVAALSYESITTVYLGFDGAIALPKGLVRLDDAPGQWVFDRRDILARRVGPTPALASLVAVVISANGPHDHLLPHALATACEGQLRRLKPDLPTCTWSQVIAERRATYACIPEATRPQSGAIGERLGLAGDYTDPEFPATLEAAVRSGHRAAEALLECLR